MTPPAFQFYPSDFLASTSEMTAEEVGVHIRLLSHQWIKGGLPNDDARLLAMAGQCQASSLAYAKSRFGICEDGLLRHARLESERSKQAAFRQKQALNGAKRWAGNAKPHAKPVPGQEPNACSPSPSLNTPIVPTGDGGGELFEPGEAEKPQASAPAAGEPPEGFTEFWDAYPRRDARLNALKAWAKVSARDHQAILADVKRRCGSDQWRKEGGKFVPLPATYLRGERWKDEAPATGTDPDDVPYPEGHNWAGMTPRQVRDLLR